MVFTGKPILQGAWINPLAHYQKEGVLIAPGLVACEYAGTAIITSKLGATWDFLDRGGLQPIIPVGARVYRIAFLVPENLLSLTNGNRLKVAGSFSANTTGLTALSSASTGNTFTKETVASDTIFPGTTTALASDLTLKLWSAANDGVSQGDSIVAPSGNVKVYLQVCYTIPAIPAVNSPDYRYTDQYLSTLISPSTDPDFDSVGSDLDGDEDLYSYLLTL